MKLRYSIPFTALMLLFLSCDKPSDRQTDEDFEQHNTWTQEDSTAFWDKQQGGGLLVDGDTTIKL